MKKKSILIMSAMEIEAELLLKKIKIDKVNKIGKYKFYEGSVEDFPIIICECKVMTYNAAIATYIGIQKYNPIAIISQGTAGAHSSELKIGDIILGEKCINIVSAKTPNKKAGEGSNSLDWNLISFNSGEDKFEIKYSDNKLLKKSAKIQNNYGNVICGTIGSGDIWNNEIDKILFLNKKYKTLCEDMESIAIYSVANDYNVPALGIRVISNNEITGEKYDKNSSLYCQEFVYKFIKELIKEK